MDVLTACILARAAYFYPGSRLPDGSTSAAYPLPPGWNLLASIDGNDLATGRSIGPAIEVPFGFIAYNAAMNELAVALRGTDTIFEFVEDAKFLLNGDLFPGLPIDDGFSDVFLSLNVGGERNLSDAVEYQFDRLPNILAAQPKLWFTGHSLGSPLANYLALEMADLSPSVITFASPRPGSPAFAAAYNAAVPNTTRVCNVRDIIPNLPPTQWDYEHVGTAMELDSTGLVNALPSCAHSIDCYGILCQQQLDEAI